MDALLHITPRRIGDTDVNAVDARALHAALGVGRVFAAWIQDRNEQLGLVPGADYEVFSEPGNNPLGGRPRVEYVLTLDAAKHVSLAERNERGRRVRAYFIECEKSLRARPAFDPNDPRVVLAVLEAQVEKVRALEATVGAQTAAIAELAPKAATHDALMESSDTYGFRAAVKVLHKTLAVTEGEVRTLMIQRDWIQRLDGVLAPKSYGEAQGYVTARVTEYADTTGETRSRSELRITNRGLARLQKLLEARKAA